MQSPVLERLVGGAVLVALLLLLALLIGPREGTRTPDQGGAEVPSAGDAPQLSESSATAFSANAQNGGERAPALEWSGVRPGSDAEPRTPAASSPVPPSPVADNTAQPDAAPSPSTAIAPPPAGRWAVQVGSFSSRTNADRFSEWCREQGYGVKVLAGQDGARTLYRVRVGPYASREDARTAVAELALLGQSGFVSDWEDASP